jgi:hypothetical protein
MVIACVTAPAIQRAVRAEVTSLAAGKPCGLLAHLALSSGAIHFLRRTWTTTMAAITGTQCHHSPSESVMMADTTRAETSMLGRFM